MTRPSCHSLLSGIWWAALAMAALQAETRAQDVPPVFQTGPAATFQVWRDAVVAQDVPRLVALALPEARDIVRQQLTDRTKKLYQFLFAADRSVRSLLLSAGTRTWIFAHEELVNLGGGTTICVVSRAVAARGRPASRRALYEDHVKGTAHCTFLFRADGEWFVSYTWLDPSEA